MTNQQSGGVEAFDMMGGWFQPPIRDGLAQARQVIASAIQAGEAPNPDRGY